MFNGTEALGLMQSRAGVTPESLAHLKQALNSVVNEEPDVDPLANDQEVCLIRRDIIHGMQTIRT